MINQYKIFFISVTVTISIILNTGYRIPDNASIVWVFGDGTVDQFDSVTGAAIPLSIDETTIPYSLRKTHNYNTTGVFKIEVIISNLASSKTLIGEVSAEEDVFKYPEFI